jgi:hypothetical protein
MLATSSIVYRLARHAKINQSDWLLVDDAHRRSSGGRAGNFLARPPEDRL